MNTQLFTLLQAAPTGGADYSFLIMLVAMFAIFYFFMIRPQSKKQKEIQKFRDTLNAGQEVTTIGGLHGKVKHIDTEEATVTLNVATGVDLKFDKSAINPTAEKK